MLANTPSFSSAFRISDAPTPVASENSRTVIRLGSSTGPFGRTGARGCATDRPKPGPRPSEPVRPGGPPRTPPPPGRPPVRPPRPLVAEGGPSVSARTLSLREALLRPRPRPPPPPPPRPPPPPPPERPPPPPPPPPPERPLPPPPERPLPPPPKPLAYAAAP